MIDQETHLAIYRGAVRIAEARGWQAGYAAGRNAQAMDDTELVEAVGRWVLDREALGRDVGAVIRATVEDLRALEYRRSR